MSKLTLAALKRECRAIGMTASHRNGEFRINFAGGREATAYYTNDAWDALETAKRMQQEAARHYVEAL